MATISYRDLFPVKVPDDWDDDTIQTWVTDNQENLDKHFGYTEPTPPKPGPMAALGRDVAGSLITGVGQTAEFFPQTYSLISGDYEDNAFRRGSKALQAIGQSIRPEHLKAEQEAVAQRIAALEGQGLPTEFAGTIWEMVSNPGFLFSKTVETVPSLVATLGSGSLAQGIFKGVVAKASEKAVARVGAAGSRSGGAAMQGASVGDQTYEEINKQGPEEFAGSPRFQELIAQGKTFEEARHEIALEGARWAGTVAAGISFVTSKMMGVEGRVFGTAKKAEGSMLRRGATGFLKEGGQEMAEEGGGQFAQNVAAQWDKQDKDLTKGVGIAGASAFLPGGILGGGIDIVTGRPTTKVEPTDGKTENDRYWLDPDTGLTMDKSTGRYIDPVTNEPIEVRDESIDLGRSTATEPTPSEEMPTAARPSELFNTEELRREAVREQMNLDEEKRDAQRILTTLSQNVVPTENQKPGSYSVQQLKNAYETSNPKQDMKSFKENVLNPMVEMGFIDKAGEGKFSLNEEEIPAPLQLEYGTAAPAQETPVRDLTDTSPRVQMRAQKEEIPTPREQQVTPEGELIPRVNAPTPLEPKTEFERQDQTPSGEVPLENAAYQKAISNAQDRVETATPGSFQQEVFNRLRRGEEIPNNLNLTMTEALRPLIENGFLEPTATGFKPITPRANMVSPKYAGTKVGIPLSDNQLNYLASRAQLLTGSFFGVMAQKDLIEAYIEQGGKLPAEQEVFMSGFMGVDNIIRLDKNLSMSEALLTLDEEAFHALQLMVDNGAGPETLPYEIRNMLLKQRDKLRKIVENAGYDLSTYSADQLPAEIEAKAFAVYVRQKLEGKLDPAWETPVKSYYEKLLAFFRTLWSKLSSRPKQYTSVEQFFDDFNSFGINRTNYMGGKPLANEQFVENPSGFYSALARAVEGINANTMKGSQWRGTIKNLGMSTRHAEFIGLDDFLKSYEDKALSKVELVQFIKEKTPDIVIGHKHTALEDNISYEQYASQFLKGIFNRLGAYIGYGAMNFSTPTGTMRRYGKVAPDLPIVQYPVQHSSLMAEKNHFGHARYFTFNLGPAIELNDQAKEETADFSPTKTMQKEFARRLRIALGEQAWNALKANHNPDKAASMLAQLLEIQSDLNNSAAKIQPYSAKEEKIGFALPGTVEQEDTGNPLKTALVKRFPQLAPLTDEQIEESLQVKQLLEDFLEQEQAENFSAAFMLSSDAQELFNGFMRKYEQKLEVELRKLIAELEAGKSSISLVRRNEVFNEISKPLVTDFWQQIAELYLTQFSDYVISYLTRRLPEAKFAQEEQVLDLNYSIAHLAQASLGNQLINMGGIEQGLKRFFIHSVHADVEASLQDNLKELEERLLNRIYPSFSSLPKEKRTELRHTVYLSSSANLLFNFRLSPALSHVRDLRDPIAEKLKSGLTEVLPYGLLPISNQDIIEARQKPVAPMSYSLYIKQHAYTGAGRAWMMEALKSGHNVLLMPSVVDLFETEGWDMPPTWFLPYVFEAKSMLDLHKKLEEAFPDAMHNAYDQKTGALQHTVGLMPGPEHNAFTYSRGIASRLSRYFNTYQPMIDDLVKIAKKVPGVQVTQSKGDYGAETTQVHAPMTILDFRAANIPQFLNGGVPLPNMRPASKVAADIVQQGIDLAMPPANAKPSFKAQGSWGGFMSMVWKPNMVATMYPKTRAFVRSIGLFDEKFKTYYHKASDTLQPYSQLKDKTRVDDAIFVLNYVERESNPRTAQSLLRVTSDGGMVLNVPTNIDSRTLLGIKPGSQIMLSAEEVAALNAHKKSKTLMMDQLSNFLVRELAALEAQEGTEGKLDRKATQRRNTVMQIVERVKAIKNSYYIPQSRSGAWYAAVRDKDGKLLAYYGVDKEQQAIELLNEAVQKYPNMDTNNSNAGRSTYREILNNAQSGLNVVDAMLTSMEHPKVDEMRDFVQLLLEKAGERDFANLFRNSKNIPGYIHKFNKEGYVQKSTSSYLARMSYNLAHIEQKPNILKEMNNLRGTEFQKFAERLYTEYTRPENEIAMFKAITFHSILGFGNLSSASLQIFQSGISTFPMLSAALGSPIKGARFLTQGYRTASVMWREVLGGRQTVDWKADKPAEISQKLWDMVHQLSLQGKIDAPNVEEQVGANSRILGRVQALQKLGRVITKSAEIGAIPFSAAERFNRVGLVAAIDGIWDSSDNTMMQKFERMYNASHYGGVEPFNQLNFTKYMLDVTQGAINKQNRAFWEQGYAQLGTQFIGVPAAMAETFFIQFASMMGREGLASKEGKVAFMLLALMLFAFGGLFGFPYSENIVKIAEGVYNFTTKQKLNFEFEMQKILGELFGPDMGAALLRGPARLLGLDIGSRVTLGNIMPTGLFTESAATVAGGPFLDVLTQRVESAVSKLAKDDTIGAMAVMFLPVSIYNATFKLNELSEVGSVNTKGNVTVPAGKITPADLGAAAAGFKTTHLSDEQRRYLAENAAKGAVAGLKEAKTQQLVDIRLRQRYALQKGDTAEANRLGGEFAQVFQTLRAQDMLEPALHKRLNIKNSTINERVKNALMGKNAKDFDKSVRGEIRRIREVMP